MDRTFRLLKPPENPYRQTTYSTEWEFLDNRLIVDIARELGVCDSCYGFGSVEKGLELEMEAMIMSHWPPTLDVLHIRPRNPEKDICAWYNSKSPTKNPTTSPSATPTERPSATPTREGQTYPPTPVPSTSPSV